MGLGVEKAIADYLLAEGIGLGLYDDPVDGNRSIYVGEFTPGADSNGLGITIIPEGGAGFILDFWEETSVTVQVRHRSYEVAHETSRAIFTALHEKMTGEHNGIKIHRVTADAQPVSLGRDSDGRDGRIVTSQGFTVRSKTITFT